MIGDDQSIMIETSRFLSEVLLRTNNYYNSYEIAYMVLPQTFHYAKLPILLSNLAQYTRMCNAMMCGCFQYS